MNTTDLATVLDTAADQLADLTAGTKQAAAAVDEGRPWDNRPTWDNWDNRYPR